MAPVYLPLEAAGPGAAEDLAALAGDRDLFTRIRSAFDLAGILNPHVLPR